MVQTVRSLSLSDGQKKIILEKPCSLRRIFFSIGTVADQPPVCLTWLSLGDPLFCSYYTLAQRIKYFEAGGEDIFQGDLWLFNKSGGDLTYTATEILH